ncbi:alkaline phosphatase D family protein [Shewanella zhangzhouensis]|uniref:alkaline phosphatase D family protein n=1 Tax=Shewanella zhangzhouensis TaxID=2864213 RepID=UPI001C65CA4D|nr:alkaline phosphatase D family protein [Shewanella zhangzhouensis]QYK05776.1 alkaline phosphatase D family protein [Shewanella zhangzhouensis]
MDSSQARNPLPTLIAGPILRHCDHSSMTLWLVSSRPLREPVLTLNGKAHQPHIDEFPLGEAAWMYLLTVSGDDLLPEGQSISYDLIDGKSSLLGELDGLCYPGQTLPNLSYSRNIHSLLHGSCRNPHHHSGDALVAADTLLAEGKSERPALLMLSGDQVYIDDVAGPMLYAIKQVIELLKLRQEDFVGAPVAGSDNIDYSPANLYQRYKRLLPHTQYPAKTALWRWYINHPIFTSSIAENHLVSFAEMTALYLLVWSPELWHLIDIPKSPQGLYGKRLVQWQKEWDHLLAFRAGLSQVRRLMAHLPTYMIFDDHDITDDWNLTAKWEEAAYGHAFSKRIIGNALLSYCLFQAIGNAPKKFESVISELEAMLAPPRLDVSTQDAMIDKLLRFEDWHFHLDTSPRLVVLDTRTRRWRSESNLAKPSGLMDWEALMDFQQQLIGQEKVIIVSAAPMFGVKLIESVQRTATLLGGSLLVDAENWMAHPGAAGALLSMFMHRKTPQEFIILSGDVHYSFAYDVSIRFRHASPNIYQITSSGIKNQFPEKLLPWFDKLNGWLYGYFSPLNLFTKRKRMLIRGRRPNGERSKRLVNQSGIGLVHLSESGAPRRIAVLHADMSQTEFLPPREH